MQLNKISRCQCHSKKQQYRSGVPKHVPGASPTLHILHVLYQLHLIQLISSLVATPRPEMCVSDKRDMQNVQCWGGSRNVFGNPWYSWRKITHGSWMENVQIILNTESTLCLLFVCFYAPLYYLLIACMFWSYISLKFLTYNCFNCFINL